MALLSEGVNTPVAGLPYPRLDGYDRIGVPGST
jgi:hypothetical protein